MKRFLMFAAATMALSSCSFVDEAVEPVSGNDGIAGASAKYSERIVINGGSRVKETFIVASASGGSSQWSNLNYGNSGWMQVGYYDGSSSMRGLISFHLTDDESRNKSTVLNLNTRYWMKKHMTGPVTLELFPMNKRWNEGNSGVHNSHSVREGKANNYSVDGATAMDAMYGVKWKTPFVGIGTDAGSIPFASATRSPQDGQNVTWSFDITGCTPEQAARGFLVVMKEKGTSGRYYDYPVLYTSESSDSTKGPNVVIYK